MKTLRALLISLILVSATQSFAGFGSHGGDSYVDEFKAFRNWVLTILSSERKAFSPRFKYSDAKYSNALNIIQNTQLVRKDRLDALVLVNGKSVSVKSILPDSIDNLFVIDGEPKQAINIKVDGINLIIFDISEWDKLAGGLDRKVKLMAHELLGILDLEVTGESHLSQAFNESLLRKYPFSNAGEVPVIPLWSIPFDYKMQIGMNDTCTDPRQQRKLRQVIGASCKPQIPVEKPSPYHSYQCLFDGSIASPIETHYEVRSYVTTGWVPETSHTETLEGGSNNEIYHYDWGYRSFSRSWSKSYTTYTPGYPTTTTEEVSTPIHQRVCHISGTLSLLGIDPLNGDHSLKLLDRSQGTLAEVLIAASNDPEHFVRNECAKRRKNIPIGFYNDSYCQIFQSVSGSWQWELWGIHPYTTPFNQ